MTIYCSTVTISLSLSLPLTLSLSLSLSRILSLSLQLRIARPLGLSFHARGVHSGRVLLLLSVRLLTESTIFLFLH